MLIPNWRIQVYNSGSCFFSALPFWLCSCLACACRAIWRWSCACAGESPSSSTPTGRPSSRRVAPAARQQSQAAAWSRPALATSTKSRLTRSWRAEAATVASQFGRLTSRPLANRIHRRSRSFAWGVHCGRCAHSLGLRSLGRQRCPKCNARHGAGNLFRFESSAITSGSATGAHWPWGSYRAHLSSRILLAGAS